MNKISKYIFCYFSKMDWSMYSFKYYQWGVSKHEWVMKLFYTKKDKHWTEKVSGKQAASLTSDGNGYDVNLGDGLKFRLDYAQAQYMHVLLNQADKVAWKNNQYIDMDVENIDKVLNLK